MELEQIEENEEKKLEKSVCGSCLSSGRRLSRPPRGVQRLLALLLCDAAQVDMMSCEVTSDVNICWECTAALSRMFRFQRQAAKARSWLEWALSQHNSEKIIAKQSTLSSLKTTAMVLISNQDDTAETSTVEKSKIIYFKNPPFENDNDINMSDDDGDPFTESKCEAAVTDKLNCEINVNEVEKVGSDLEKSVLTKSGCKRKYRDMALMFDKLSLTEEEMLKLREQEKRTHYFASSPYKCEHCITGYRSEALYKRHWTKFHTTKCGRHECEICRRKFQTKCQLESHAREHYSCFQCRLCGLRSFNWQPTYRHYLNVHEDKPRKYRRDIQVGEMYETQVLSEAEVQQMREQDRNTLWFRTATYRCDTCIKGFKSETRYEYHQKAYHSLEAGALVCAVCAARAATRPGMARHLAAHARCYRCYACGARFSAQLNAYRHYNNVHKLGKLYPCKYCAQTFPKRFERNHHLETMHKTFPCPKCERQFKYQNALKQHIETHTPSLCVECGKWYGTRRAFAAHRQRKHERCAQAADAYCVECDKHFRNRKEYGQHISVKHTYADRVFPCTACDKTFKRKLILKNHYNMVHLNKKTYACDQCDKCFVNNGGLKHHKTFVHERVPKPRNYTCEICSRAFSGKLILENHRRTHTGERPYACTHCSAAFAQKVALTYHMRRIHLKQTQNSCASMEAAAPLPSVELS